MELIGVLSLLISHCEIIMKNIVSIGLLLVISCFYSHSYAEAFNGRTDLKPKSRVRINKVLAKSYLPIKESHHRTNPNTSVQRGDSRSGAAKTSSASIQNINSFSNVRYAPREVITSVKGDIINICFHCR